MASSKEYLDFIMDQLSSARDVSYRAMMGEYVVYFRDKVIGGVYDNRFLVKRTAAGEKLMPGAVEEIPYDGAKPMLLVEDLEDKELLAFLLEAMYDELPAPKKKK
ncbi:MAG: competence protein TfoX [Clostridia bacterium]|nr:competence protein TfoX [Clostridia bacterium]